jgi:two-component system OmpR family sensor kinase/two-component system phosphate regulon sensor histidine kinase PhoR
MEAKLDGYVMAINKYIAIHHLSDSTISDLSTMMRILPEDIRLTIVKANGEVLYDKDVKDVRALDNHLNRPEIMKAQYQDFGSNIRMSASTNHEYLYYARFINPYFIRVALPYTGETRSLLQADNWFLYVVLGLLIAVLLIVNLVAGRFGKSITKLRDFVSKVKSDKPLPRITAFPGDELGQIGQDLAEIFGQKEKAKADIEKEREKLKQHFQYSELGICMFTPNNKKIFANAHFMQYLNLIVNKPTFDVCVVFEDEAFAPLISFIREKPSSERSKPLQIEKNGKVFSLQAIIFDDKSFEITIKDVTKIEKNRILKQEMTNNIAHELRTPVAGLRGYLETLNEHDLPQEKRNQFIERAYKQVIRLSALIDDVSLLSNIEETPGRYAMEAINLSQLVNDVRIDLSDKLTNSQIKLNIELRGDLTVTGNYTLLYSVFRNLMDNSISYAGSGCEIHIKNYMEDEKYLYLSYSDTGSGVDEQLLNRLFERFYRVHEGRTRDNGGSGLGLSIVKNAIALHHGEIQARIPEQGGLEFLFTLAK